MPPKTRKEGTIKRPTKRTQFDLAAKLTILKRVEDNPHLPKGQIAKEFKIAPSTLTGIIKQAEKIRASAVQGSRTRMKVKVSKYDRIEKALSEWVAMAGAGEMKVALQGPNLKEKAKQLALQMDIEGFTASDGWLDRFKKRHKILFKARSGESASVSDSVVLDWKEKILPCHVKGYDLRDQYNCDEFGLFINMHPDKAMMHQTDDGHGNKKSKARVTVLLGSNADGSDKLPPLVIGKSKNPRCFANIRALPCPYTNQSNAWMTMQEFTTWLSKLDARMRIQKRKIVLFVDNCPAHPPNVVLDNVKIVFLPKNCTSKLQPMDQGIIKSVKHYYKTRLVQRLINHIGRPDLKKVYNITLYQALHFLQWAWNQVTPTAIRNCYRKAGFLDEYPTAPGPGPGLVEERIETGTQEVQADGGARRAHSSPSPPSSPELVARKSRCRGRQMLKSDESDIDDDLADLADLEDDLDDLLANENLVTSEGEDQHQDQHHVDLEQQAHDEGDVDEVEVLVLDDEVAARWDEVCVLLGVPAATSFDSFVNADNDLHICEVLSFDEIAAKYREPATQDAEEGVEEDDADDEQPPALVTNIECLQAVETVRRFLCQQEEKAIPDDILDLTSWLETVVLKACIKKRRSSIPDFFKPI